MLLRQIIPVLVQCVLLASPIFPYWSREFFKSTRFLQLINTQFGPIQGRQDYDPENQMDSDFWGGIPYAKVPVGAKRFARPEKWTDKYEGVLDATNYRHSCLQVPYFTVIPTFDHRSKWNISRIPTSSDCLYLNIWRPAFTSRSTSADWIHYMSTLVILYDQDFYWNRPEDPVMSGSGQSWSNDLLVVTMGYRTGLMGYFNGSNMALYDIKMGLEWIYENIHSFRGNRSKITVLGAGSAATVATLLAINQKYWPQKIFSRLILMNGKGLFSPGTFQSPHEISLYSNNSAYHYGCMGADYNINMTCMEQLDDNAMVQNPYGQLPSIEKWWWYYNRFPWTPTIDGEIVREEIHYLLRFNEYRENELREMFKKFRVEGINLLTGIPNEAGVQGLAYLGVVDIESASYKTILDYQDHASKINSDLGRCGMSSIIFQYNDWTDPPDPDRARRDSLVAMATDRFHRCPMVNFANFMLKQAKYGPKPVTEDEGRVWIYNWDHTTGKTFPDWMGAVDGSDFLYMMTFPMNTEANPSFTADEAKLSLAFSSYIGNFAWYGDPNYVPNGYWDGREEKKTPMWPEATLENHKKYLNLRLGNFTVLENMKAKDCVFWQKFLPTLHAEFDQIISKSGILNLPTEGIFYFGTELNGPATKGPPYLRCKREFAYQ